MQEDRQQLAVEVDAESLRQDVGQLGFGVDKTGDVDAAGDTIAELVRVPKDMLSLLESNRIGSQVKGGLAIQEKRCRRRDAIPKIFKKVDKKVTYVCGGRHTVERKSTCAVARE